MIGINGDRIPQAEFSYYTLFHVIALHKFFEIIAYVASSLISATLLVIVIDKIANGQWKAFPPAIHYTNCMHAVISDMLQSLRLYGSVHRVPNFVTIFHPQNFLPTISKFHYLHPIRMLSITGTWVFITRAEDTKQIQMIN